MEVCAPLANPITAGTDNPTENGSATGEPSPGRQPFPSITITSQAIGQTMLTAERGGFMLGRKMKGNARYP